MYKTVNVVIPNHELPKGKKSKHATVSIYIFTVRGVTTFYCNLKKKEAKPLIHAVPLLLPHNVGPGTRLD